ncbi:lysozyme [Burkholderia sp. Ax-1724]|uniref:lysozyme n=1 Tax=Burkholderia sp. Ax-1724 TaxID=2608336 RepID=UPI0014217AD7|nr:lysozyme [Burkholderia sp. Ax-1724]NIF51397.1 lysozyme [Burkholderia sp. Ax-1724]
MPFRPQRRSLAAIVGTAAAAGLLTAVPKFEGVSLVAYRDPVGVMTACIGETRGVQAGERFTLAECTAKLEPRLAGFAEDVDHCTPLADRTPAQRVAIIDFAYNEGSGTYCRSSIAANFRAGNIAGACRSFNESPTGKPQYVTAAGEELPGLVKRRAKERAWCEGREAP